ncbi:conserved hypothetical protein [Histoplasma capsulatum H143]|uniref:Glycoprotease family protein n=1 Tax=Ajellomyces capsulatus (strain H143) TaxID=544712 RepID=C6HR71_AJECH|nr:conserved hypothetical protein [Histoplasma capsulatum H143]
MNDYNAQYEVPPMAASYLRAQNIPTFPLSSPIKEEIYTPFESPDSSQLAAAAPAQDKENPSSWSEDYFTLGQTRFEASNAKRFDGQTEDKEKLLGENSQAPRPSRWDSIKRPGRTIMKRNPKEAATNTKTRPGLNLVTNFSNDTKYRRDAVSKRRQSAGGRGYIDLNDLRFLSKGKETTARPAHANRLLPERRLSSTRGYGEIKDDVEDTSQGVQATSFVKQMKKSPLDALRVSPSKTQDLSPSDRPIMIGLSVPYRDAASPGKTKKLAGDSTPAKNNVGTPNSQRSTNTTPITPTIIITPAREDNPWDTFSSGSPEARRTRPPSSVYSQPTPRVKDGRPPSIIPPVPAIPASHSFTKPAEAREVFDDQVSIPARRNRAFSVGTVFEDDSPDCRRTGRPRSLSDESKLQAGIPSRYSMDTIATRPRSQGWWNLLLSPLLSRSNTMASKMSLRSPQDETPPAIPPFPFAVSQQLQVHVNNNNNNKYREKQFDEEVSFFSPDTPYSGEEKESVWASAAGTVGKPSGEREGSSSDDDEWDDDDCSQPSSWQSRNKSSHISTVSAQTIPFMISSPTSAGYAQEQFHQSVHNYFIPTKQSPPPPLPSTSHFTGFSSNSNVAAFPPVPGENVQIQNQNPNNPFFQRFVESIRSGAEPRERSNSDSTVIEDEPDVSPNVRQATVTPFLRAAPIGPFQTGPTGPLPPIPRRVSPPHKISENSPSISVGTSSTQPPPYSPPNKVTKVRRYRAILPSDLHPQPQSPGPLSPEGQTQMASRGGILLSSMRQAQAPQPPAATYHARNDPLPRGVLPPRLPNNPVHLSDIERPGDVRAQNESRRQRLEREDRMARKVGGLWRGRGCLSNRGCFGRSGREGRKRRRWYMCIAVVLIIIIIVSVVLAIILTRKRDDAPESRWLNLTGYPPMPTGVSTIAGPNAAVANSGCIRPTSMWSCALPKENQDANKPYDPDQPNFRIQINFQNGTFSHSTVPLNRKRSTFTFPDNLGSSRRRSLQERSGGLSPIPAPPGLEEQAFLGNTSDGVTAPFAGEDTPFFATFLSPEPIKISTRQRRADTPPPHGTDADDLRDAIPDPAHNPDGTAAPANLLPLPIAQPIRLYDRGLPTEHYGFYTYFDRSIFLKADRPLTNDSVLAVAPDDQNGGSTRSAARTRCTWTQTRFLVQIWTQPSQNSMGLIPLQPSPTPTPGSSSPPAPESPTAAPFPTAATDFTRPGSFPYPITIVLDRHGGDPKSKMVYCYQLDLEQRYVLSSKTLQVEDRGYRGQLVNPGSLLGGSARGTSSAGGFDGGTGGCRCEWRNWLAVR